jgi:signal transduction histidine kinase
MGPLRLEDLVDRTALREVASSFQRLCGISIRIISGSGTVLANAVTDASVCMMVNEYPGGRQACTATVNDALHLRVLDGMPTQHRCFTGAIYRVIPIEYDRRVIGRIVLGPYLPTSVMSVPESLLAVDPGIDSSRSNELLLRMPRVDEASIEAMSAHITSVLGLILFSGHKALLTSKMHLASIRESYRELSEKKEKLEEAYDQLKELDRLKSNFLATVSHELRTPLTSIMGYSEMLAEGIGGPLNSEQLEFVQTIRTKSDQLLELIMSLLDLSKLESGTVIVHRTSVPMTAVLGETISTLAPVAAKRNIRLSAEAPPDLPDVLGDADRLRQVFINLTENSIKFTEPDGSVLLSARAIYEEPEHHDDHGLVLMVPMKQCVEVRVIDTGIGIPENERTKVFNPFYQVDQSSTRKHAGTGLGLAIVKRLVDAHHGMIRIESNTPQGAVFVVTLPASPPPGTVPPPARSSSKVLQ